MTDTIQQYLNGEFYMIDRGYSNAGIVELIDHGKHFATVEYLDTGERWQTMTYRLSKLTDEERKILKRISYLP